ncbi:MAG: type II secretion system protein GspK [Myxococcota bacterium]|jgi:general secretion pathway protein K|nr:type II secretion system protein GspK [Myxococcota bacterium]
MGLHQQQPTANGQAQANTLERVLLGLGLLGLRWVRWVGRPVIYRNGGRRGVAMLMVISYVAVMTALVISSFYNSQVTFAISVNVRDDLKAYYKARSALNLGRLMLAYQYELEKDEFFGPRMRKSNFQMYQIVDLLMDPFKTGAVMVDVPGERPIASYDLADAGATGLGDESGDYSVRIMPEEGRLNINRFATGIDQVVLYNLCMMTAPQHFDDLFNPADKSGKRDERTEVIGSMIDWVDPDGERIRLTNACVVDGVGGDEDGRYRDGARRYESKNAKLTTLDELYLVHGVTDDFMETFRDTLTVYPVDRINVNLATGQLMYALLCNAVQAEGYQNAVWACADPRISTPLMLLSMGLEGYQQFVLNPINLLHLYTVMGELSVIPGVTPPGTVVPFRNQAEFVAVLRALQNDPIVLQRFLAYSMSAYLMFGEQLALMDPALLGTTTITFDDAKIINAISTVSPRIFRIIAVGEYNGTRKTLTAVIDFNQPEGKYLFWREY